MDRGLALSMIGRGITWGDVYALFAHLPHDSHTMKLMNPKAYREGELRKISSQIGGEIVDAINTSAALSRGVPVEKISQMPSAIDLWAGNAEREKPTKEEVPERKVMSPSEARAAIAARATPKPPKP